MIHINSTEEKKIDFNINDFINEDFLKNFKVYYPQSLFEPDWEMLAYWRCPICRNRLKFPKGKSIAYCNGKKHMRTFIINKDKLVKLSFI